MTNAGQNPPPTGDYGSRPVSPSIRKRLPRLRFTQIDPGGIRVARGVHLVLALLLGVAFGHWTATTGSAALLGHWGDWFGAHAPWFAEVLEAPRRFLLAQLVAGLTAAHFVLFTPPSSRSGEWRRFRLMIPVIVGYFLALGLAAPGGWGMGEWPMFVIWVFIIGGGLFLRRYGPTGGAIGTSLIILSLFGMILAPTRAEGLWLPVAALLGAVAAGIIRFGAYRPSAVGAYDSERARFHRCAANWLSEFAEGLRTMAPHGAPPSHLRGRWSATRRAMQAAALEDPPRAELFQRQTAADYRLILAAEAMVDAIHHLRADPLWETMPVKAMGDALDKIANRSAAAAGHRMIASARIADTISPIRQEILAAQAERKTKLQALRALTSLIRLDRALDPQPPVSPQSSTATAPRVPPHVKTVANRLALQGLVAGTVTVLLAFLFRLDHAYWATLTVALVLAGTMGETLNRTLKRAFGTAVGVLIAMGLSLLIGNNLWLGLPIVLMSIGAVVIFLDTRYEIASGLIGFAVVLGLHLLEHLTMAGMLARIYETFIGAGVALVVALFVVPIYSTDTIGGKMREMIARCRANFEELRASASLGSDFTAPLAESLRDLMKEAPAIEAERFFGRLHEEEASDGFVLLEALISFLGLFERARAAYRHFGREKRAEAEAVLEELDARVLAAFDACRGEGTFPTDFQELIAKFATVAPLDGSLPAEEVFHLVEQLYYGRRITETLRDLNEVLARV